MDALSLSGGWQCPDVLLKGTSYRSRDSREAGRRTSFNACPALKIKNPETALLENRSGLLALMNPKLLHSELARQVRHSQV
jgi:hypothetical protein